MSSARSPLSDGACLRRVVEAGAVAEPLVGALERQHELLEQVFELARLANARLDILLLERLPLNGAGHV